MLNSESNHKRNPTHEINSLFVNRWSPRSMTGEDIDDNDLLSLFLKLLDGHHPHLIISHGGLSMQKEIQKVGINSLIYYTKAIKYGLKMLLP